MNASDNTKRKHLGRGLSALFGEQEEATIQQGPLPGAPVTDATIIAKGGVTILPVDLLFPSPLQPRQHFDEGALTELAASIAEKGILQPLLVRPDPNQSGRYEIIAGERRWRASQRAQVHQVPALVRDFTDAEVLEVALIENLQRQDLSPIEEAKGYQRLLKDFGHTQENVGEIVGKSRAHVANMLRLLNLPEAVLDMVDKGLLSAGQARPLIGVTGAEAAARLIAKKGMSARQAERFAKGFGKKRKLVAIGQKDADTVALEKSLQQATGYDVKITFDGAGGTVIIGYSSLEQLDDVAKRLSANGRAPKVETNTTGWG